MPPRTLLYVGCSFVDSAVNDLLSEAHERFPGREYFAILRLPPALRDKPEVTADELADISAEHHWRGAQPIRVRGFAESPQCLSRLA